ncbi:MAG: hypothetical protein WKF84_24775 [Pyrinomonadaceae bacterium]
MDAIRQRTTAVLAQVADEAVGISLQRTSPTIGHFLYVVWTEVGVYVDGVRYTNSTQRAASTPNLNEPTALRSRSAARAEHRTVRLRRAGGDGTIPVRDSPSFDLTHRSFTGNSTPSSPAPTSLWKQHARDLWDEEIRIAGQHGGSPR